MQRPEARATIPLPAGHVHEGAILCLQVTVTVGAGPLSLRHE